MLAKQARGRWAPPPLVALLEARVAEVALQRTQLEDLIQSLARSRDENLLVDIEAALRMAIQQGAITGSTEPLVLVLRQSDERLGALQPAAPRRRAPRDRARPRSRQVGRRADIASLTIKLDETMRMVDELPLLATPSRAATWRGCGACGRAPQPRRHRQHPRRRPRPTACGRPPGATPGTASPPRCGTRCARWCASRASNIPTPRCSRPSRPTSCAREPQRGCSTRAWRC